MSSHPKRPRTAAAAASNGHNEETPESSSDDGVSDNVGANVSINGTAGKGQTVPYSYHNHLSLTEIRTCKGASFILSTDMQSGNKTWIRNGTAAL